MAEARAGAGAAFGDLENLAFGRVEQLGDRPALRVKAAVGDVAADADQVPGDGPLAHDVRVGGDVDGAGHAAGQQAQIGHAAGAVQFLGLLKAFGDRDQVARPALVVDAPDRLVDQAMVLAIEVLVDQPVRDQIPGATFQQQAAEYRLLGLDGMRRNLERGRVGHGASGVRDYSATTSTVMRATRSACRFTSSGKLPRLRMAPSGRFSSCLSTA
jgi:hypothetical protein